MNITSQMRQYIDLVENAGRGIPLSRLLAAQEDIPHVPRIVERSAAEQTWDSVANWETVPEDIKTRLQTAYPNIADLALEMSGGLAHQMETEHVAKEHCIRFAAESNEVQSLKRDFDYNRNVLDLMEFYLADDFQGQDVGKRVLAGTYAVAKKLGAVKMMLEATDAGTYVWAKAGFLPQNWEHVRSELIAMLQDRHWAQEGRDKIMQYLKDASPTAIWGMAWDETRTSSGIQIGKRLLGQLSSWFGEFVVNDANQEAQLQKFLNSKSSGVPY